MHELCARINIRNAISSRYISDTIIHSSLLKLHVIKRACDTVLPETAYILSAVPLEFMSSSRSHTREKCISVIYIQIHAILMHVSVLRDFRLFHAAFHVNCNHEKISQFPQDTWYAQGINRARSLLSLSCTSKHKNRTFISHRLGD